MQLWSWDVSNYSVWLENKAYSAATNSISREESRFLSRKGVE